MHILLMILGPVLAAREEKSTVYARKRSQKALHLLFYAVFKFHNEIELYDMFTLHSWLAITSISAFCLQRSQQKQDFKPWHEFVGMVIFLLGICTAEIGLAQVSYFLGRGQEALIVNFTLSKANLVIIALNSISVANALNAVYAF
ncbi:hypothetical protein FEM48_Zijuj10G0112100 [Ziziphus jujuba var. spinosa]|uniref:Cytochrome b561 domain-containing protein n=1 Tax=Ziziphus jujuba var. spinosa TaxID=714518 RepID=A0A978UN17_ZIZJJ|nr:hypothetical protein FEM48_Zijuj10G0112100 [Ziziphus jujuba var. spinosa]